MQSMAGSTGYTILAHVIAYFQFIISSYKSLYIMLMPRHFKGYQGTAKVLCIKNIKFFLTYKLMYAYYLYRLNKGNNNVTKREFKTAHDKTGNNFGFYQGVYQGFRVSPNGA